jgi:hypothetical protein
MTSFYAIGEMVMYFVLLPIQVLAIILYTSLEGFPGLVKRFNMHLLAAGFIIWALSVWMYWTTESAAYPFHILLGLAGAFLTTKAKKTMPEHADADTPPAE